MTRFETASSVLERELAKPYAYGRSDCFLMGMAMVDALRGTDHRKAYAGRYKTLRGAHGVLKRSGHDTLAELMEALLGTRIAPLQAHIGDVGIIALQVEGSKRIAEHVGVHDGRQWVVKAEDGPMYFGSAHAAAAFRS